MLLCVLGSHSAKLLGTKVSGSYSLVIMSGELDLLSISIQ